MKTTSADAMSVSSVPALTIPDKVASVGAPPAVAAAPMTAPRPAIVRPLAPERYEVRFTASAETCAKLRRAQDLLRHAIPTGDTATVVDRALTVLIEDLERKKFAITDRPRPSQGTSGSTRTPPAHVRRAVSRRDAGRCAFVGMNGRRCETRAFLEFHHVIPYAMGGEATVENIQLRCRAHNGYEAGLLYGQGRHEDDGDSVRERPASYGKQLGPDRVRAGSATPPSAPA